MKEKRMAPVHPGEILMKQFLEPLGMSQNRLASRGTSLTMEIRRTGMEIM